MFKQLSKCLNSRGLWPAIALVIAINLWLFVKAGGDGLLYNAVAPRGIVSLELAGNPARGKEIIHSWRRTPSGVSWSAPAKPGTQPPSLVEVALSSLRYDNVYMFSYTITLALTCLIAATVIETRHPKLKRFGLARAGTLLARVQVLVLVLDATENFAVWRMLRGSDSYVWAALARSAALPKFALIGITAIYILFVFIVRISGPAPRRSHVSPRPNAVSVRAA
jgi:hypothetical protein